MAGSHAVWDPRRSRDARDHDKPGWFGETESSYSGNVEYKVDGHASAITLSVHVTDADHLQRADEPGAGRDLGSPVNNGVTVTGYDVMRTGGQEDR